MDESIIRACTPRMNKYMKKPFPKQAAFLLFNGPELLYGGQVGGGKTSSLLLCALQYADVPGYNALILRRTRPEITKPGAVWDLAQDWLSGHEGVRFNQQSLSISFPEGSSLSFGHMRYEKDKRLYQGPGYHFCTAAGTRILMADGSYKRVEAICAGDQVMTLRGARPIASVSPPRLAECVRAEVVDEAGEPRGWQVHTTDHRVLTTDQGWASYDDIVGASRPCATSLSTQTHVPRKSSLLSGPIFLSASQMSSCPFLHQMPQLGPSRSHVGHADCVAIGASPGDEENGFVESDGEHQEQAPPRQLSVPVVLHVHHPQAGCSRPDIAPAPYESSRAQQALQPGGSQDDCLSSRGLCGERARHCLACGQDSPQQQVCAAGQSNGCRNTYSTPLQAHGRHHSTWYAHPYALDRRCSDAEIEVGALRMSPIGKRTVYGFTVGDENHYITETGLVQANCGFDELTHFYESQYLYMFSRLRRTVDVNVPVRMRATSNPGNIGHAWVKARFIPPNGTKPFLPARLHDNPFMDADDYVKQFDNMPAAERKMLLEGNWDVAFGGLFKMDDLSHTFRSLPNHNGWLVENKHFQAGEVFITVDPAASTKNTADYTVISTWCKTPDNQLLWLDCDRCRINIPDIVPRIERAAAKHQASWVGIEDAGPAMGVYQQAARTHLCVRPLKPGATDKKTRAHHAIVMAEAGRIFVPEQAPWLDECKTELLMFTGEKDKDAHDDVVDTLAYACQYMLRYGDSRIYTAPRVLRLVR